MASIGRIVGTALNTSFEQTSALANFNFDFTLYKVDAPKEYAGVGSQLSAQRRNDAEIGSSHVVARKLGALFRDVVPSTPELLKTYGSRASAIFRESASSTQGDPLHGVFASAIGPDAKSMWAAATSGKHAIACHLLACLLARIWDAPEAISYWVEIIARRKQDIALENQQIADPEMMLVSQEIIDRKDIADWDASARAWLRIADSVMKLQQTQLRLILDNISLPVNSKADCYESIMEAWKTSFQQMESLLNGYPQAARDGAIILGLDAWHLYPDMIVLGSETKEIKQNDILLKGLGVLTVGLTGERTPGHEGIYWSMPLRYLRHYGLPVTRKRSMNSGEGKRITIDQFILVLLAAFLRTWDDGSLPTNSVVAFFIDIAEKICQVIENSTPSSKGNPNEKERFWLSVFMRSAQTFLSATGDEKKLFQKLWNVGKSYSPMFRGMEPFSDVFTVTNFLYFATDIGDSVELLREIARSSNRQRRSDYLIRYRVFTDGPYEYTTAIPQKKRTFYGEEKENHTRWLPYDNLKGVMSDDYTEYPDHELFTNVDLSENNPWADHFNTHFPEKGRVQSQERECESSKDKENAPDLFQVRTEELAQLGENIESCKDLLVSETYASANVQPSSIMSVVDDNLYAVIIGNVNIQVLKRLEWQKIDKKDEIDPHQVEQEAKAFELKFKSTTDMKRRLFERISVRDLAKLFSLDLNGASSSNIDYMALRGVGAISELYSHFDGATIDVKAIKLHLGESRWLSSATSRGHDQMAFNLSFTNQILLLDHAQCFSCIAMLETGFFDLDPAQLRSVMALSAVDSLYVSSTLLHDPADCTQQFRIKRLTGNIGRAGLAFLVPPVEPMIKEFDPVDKWQLLDHADFDGKLENNFSSTSLQLSFTEAILPMNVGFSGGVDNEAFFLETLVSVYDAGDWVADINALEALKSVSFHRCLPCRDSKVCDIVPKFTSADRFAEILCPNDNVRIVRAWKNWQARLAATSICIARGYSVVVMNEDTCWKCIETTVDEARRKKPSEMIFVIS